MKKKLKSYKRVHPLWLLQPGCASLFGGKMNNKIFKSKSYKHIDEPFDVKHAVNNIKNDRWVISHGFYPFISYEMCFKKYSKEIDETTKHHWKEKKRPIKYSSHIDRYIYQWYSYLLNIAYNDYCKKNDISKAAIAYRTCLKGMTNIEFTKIAFDFMKNKGDCYVLVSDFSKFFDYIEHKKLKEKICEIMNKEQLPDDYYKVFRSMTKYAYIEREIIEKYLIQEKIETKETLKHTKSFFENISWRDSNKDLKQYIIRNNDEYGIPQGSPLSGIFANIYMIDFDKKVNEYVKQKSGLYMRYSDDLIIVLPKDNVSSPDEIWSKLQSIKNEYMYLMLNKDKSSIYLYSDKKVISLHNEVVGMKESANEINFLGFSFDGKYIKFRDKTLTKFFYKLYRKIDTMKQREEIRIKKGRKRKSKIDKLRIINSIRYSNHEKRKFIDYVKRAQKVYPTERYITNFKKKSIEKIILRFQKTR